MRNNFSVHQKGLQPQFMNQSMNVPREELRVSQIYQGQVAFRGPLYIPQIRLAPQQPNLHQPNNSQPLGPNQVITQQNHQTQIQQSYQSQQPLQHNQDTSRGLNQQAHLQTLLVQKDNQIKALHQSLSQIALKFNDAHEQLKSKQNQSCSKCADFDQLQFQIQQERIIHQEKYIQQQQEIEKLRCLIREADQQLINVRFENEQNKQKVEKIMSRKISSQSKENLAEQQLAQEFQILEISEKKAREDVKEND